MLDLTLVTNKIHMCDDCIHITDELGYKTLSIVQLENKIYHNTGFVLNGIWSSFDFDNIN